MSGPVTGKQTLGVSALRPDSTMDHREPAVRACGMSCACESTSARIRHDSNSFSRNPKPKLKAVTRFINNSLVSMCRLSARMEMATTTIRTDMETWIHKNEWNSLDEMRGT